MLARRAPPATCQVGVPCPLRKSPFLLVMPPHAFVLVLRFKAAERIDTYVCLTSDYTYLYYVQIYMIVVLVPYLASSYVAKIEPCTPLSVTSTTEPPNPSSPLLPFISNIASTIFSELDICAFRNLCQRRALQHAVIKHNDPSVVPA